MAEEIRKANEPERNAIEPIIQRVHRTLINEPVYVKFTSLVNLLARYTVLAHVSESAVVEVYAQACRAVREKRQD